MKSKKRKLLALVLLVVLVLSQSLCVFASDTPTYDKSRFKVLDETEYPYQYNLAVYTESSGTITVEYFTYYGTSEIVLYASRYSKDGKWISSEPLSNEEDYCSWVVVQTDKDDGSVTTSNTATMGGLSLNCDYYSGDYAQDWLLYSNIKIFDTKAHAQAYLDSGSEEGLLRGEDKEYDLEGVYLEDFSVELHYSNYAKHIFWDFHYQIPESIEQAIAEGADCYIDLSGTYKIHTTSLSNSAAPWNIDEEVPINTVINLAEHPNGYSMNFDDVVDMEELENWFWGVGESTVNSAVTGSGSYGFNDYLCRTDTSRFDLTLIPVVNGTYGTGCSTSINLLNPKELSYWNSTPSDISTGDYDNVSNLTNSEGYYNTVVGYDNIGNPTYTYYYVNNSDNSVTNIEYKEDGSTEEVASDGSINVTPTFNPTFNNNPTISPTIDINIEGDNLNNEVDNIVGEGTGTKEDNESFVEKFLGFFNVFKDNDFLNVFALLFAFLPTSVSDVIVTAIGIIAGIAVFKFFRK